MTSRGARLIQSTVHMETPRAMLTSRLSHHRGYVTPAPC